MSATRAGALHPILKLLVTAALLAGGVGRASDAEKKAPPEPTCPEGMVLIPGGSFPLGGKKMVKVKAFCLDETEVTARAYEVCVDEEECHAVPNDIALKEASTYQMYPKSPINDVTWKDAREYCAFEMKRLPTEAEWEWAARGGPAGNAYPWGNDPPSSQPCWSGSGSDAGAATRKRPCPATDHQGDVTPQGIRGLAGNVAEWTATRGDEKGEYVAKGAWYRSTEKDLLAAIYREASKATERSPYIGFRCAQDPDH